MTLLVIGVRSSEVSLCIDIGPRIAISASYHRIGPVARGYDQTGRISRKFEARCLLGSKVRTSVYDYPSGILPNHPEEWPP